MTKRVTTYQLVDLAATRAKRDGDRLAALVHYILAHRSPARSDRLATILAATPWTNDNRRPPKDAA